MLSSSSFRLCSQASTSAVKQVRAYRAAILKEAGKKLQVETQKRELVPKDRELLVKVDSAGVNNVDVQMCKGVHHHSPELPITPGYELAGEVVAVGGGVEDYAVGDRVLGIKTWGQGAFAEHCLLHVNSAHPLPHSLKYEEAVCLPAAYGSAYLALKKANVKEGQHVLIVTSAGSTGVAAIELAVNVFKCHVIAAAENEAKCDIVRKLGVQSTVEYTDEHLAKLVQSLTKGVGCSAVIDTVGGFWFDLALQCLSPGGHLVSTGFSSQQVPLLKMSDLIKYDISVSGVRLSALAETQPRKFHSTIRKILEWKDEGYFQVVEPKQFALDEVNEALEYVDEKKPIGKVVLICRT